MCPPLSPPHAVMAQSAMKIIPPASHRNTSHPVNLRSQSPSPGGAFYCPGINAGLGEPQSMTNKKSLSCILCAVAAFCFACNESVEYVDTDDPQNSQQNQQKPNTPNTDPNGCNAANKGKVICTVEEGYAVIKTCDGRSFKTTSGCDPNICNADNTGCGTASP